MAEDPIIQRIESFRCRRGQLFAEHRNRGYTLYRASSGALVARLRPTGQDDRVEVLYWLLWKNVGRTLAHSGRTVLPLNQALKFIASEDSSGLFRARPRHRKCGKSSSGTRRSRVSEYDDFRVVVDTHPFEHKAGLLQHAAGSCILDRYHAYEGQGVDLVSQRFINARATSVANPWPQWVRTRL